MHKIHEINSTDWPAFCQRVSEQRAGAQAKIEVIGADGVKTERVAGAALESMTFAAGDSCSDVIIVRLRNTREIIYEIVEPIHLTLRASETPNDFNLIQIEAESGVTFITLHPALHAQMLEGLKIQ